MRKDLLKSNIFFILLAFVFVSCQGDLEFSAEDAQGLLAPDSDIVVADNEGVATGDEGDSGQSENEESAESEEVEIVQEDESEDEKVCVPGHELSIWVDENRNLKIDKKDRFHGKIVAYEGNLSAAENYNYYSWSAHPYVGPTPAGFESHVFFYYGTDGLTLNFYHNIDEGGHKSNRVHWNLYTKGNNCRDRVLLSDDRGELKAKRCKKRKNKRKKRRWEKSYSAKYRYWRNTDGGIIGPFVGKDFVIAIKAKRTRELLKASFYSADGKVIPLNKGKKIKSMIFRYHKYVNCE